MQLGKTLEAIRAMPSADYITYQKYYAVNFWGEDRADWRMANIAYILFAANSKKPAPFKDFLWKERNNPPVQMPIAELKARLDGISKRKAK